MTPAEIRRRALLAAAKVALSFVALGCSDVENSDPLVGATPATGACQPADARCAGSAGAPGAAAGASAAGARTDAGPGDSVAAAGGSAAGGGSGGSGGSAAGGAAGAGGGAGSSGAQACQVPAAPPFAPELLACCVEVVKTTFPIEPPPAEPPSFPEGVAGCCRAVVAERDRLINESLFDAADALIPWMLAYDCCSYGLVPEQTGPTCTPWGPPMPPGMRLDLLAEVA